MRDRDFTAISISEATLACSPTHAALVCLALPGSGSSNLAQAKWEPQPSTEGALLAVTRSAVAGRIALISIKILHGPGPQLLRGSPTCSACVQRRRPQFPVLLVRLHTQAVPDL